MDKIVLINKALIKIIKDFYKVVNFIQLLIISMLLIIKITEISKKD